MSNFIPNTYQKPNFIADKLAYFLTPAENVVLDKAVREILGWHNRIESRKAPISLSVFTNGKKDKNGVVLCYGCGLGINTIRETLTVLHKFNILLKVGEPTQDGQEYWIQDDDSKIDWTALEDRKNRKQEKYRKQTEAATQASLDIRGVTSDVTPPYVERNPPLTSDVNKETQRNPIETQLYNHGLDENTCQPSVQLPDGQPEPPAIEGKKDRAASPGGPDYLADVQAGARAGVSEATAPDPFDQHFGYRDEFLAIFREKAGHYPDQDEKDAISALAAEDGALPATWEKAWVESKLNWTGNGKPSLARVMEVYRAGGTWAAWLEKKYPKKGRTNGRGYKQSSFTNPVGGPEQVAAVGLGEWTEAERRELGLA